MNLPPYLEENILKILTLEDQNINLWKSNYSDYEKEFKVVADINDLFSRRKPQRAEIAALFKEDEYTGFIAAMMWGGINPSRPKEKGGNDTPFRSLLRHDTVKVQDAIKYATEQVLKWNGGKAHELYDVNKPSPIVELFVKFSIGGKHKLPGVEYAYFTKLFFFLGLANGVNYQPLILDKWTSTAHCALRIQMENKEASYAKSQKIGSTHHPNLPTSPEDKGRLYLKYLEDMHGWAELINRHESDRRIDPTKLEQFIFGESLKSDKTEKNPRIVFLKIIAAHFGKPLKTANDQTMPKRNKTPNTLTTTVVPHKSKGKYVLLNEHFESKSRNGVTLFSLSGGEVENIIESQLPNWAYDPTYSFWGNSGADFHVQKNAWLSNGYRAKVKQMSKADRTVSVEFKKE